MSPDKDSSVFLHPSLAIETRQLIELVALDYIFKEDGQYGKSFYRYDQEGAAAKGARIQRHNDCSIPGYSGLDGRIHDQA